jgi:hypothetical protein
MRSDYLPDDLQKLWQELAINPVQVSPDDLRREARKLRGGVALRNWFAAGVACAAIVAYSFWFVVFKTTLGRIGAALAIAGALNVIVQFLKRPALTMPGATAIECIRFYRAELERQRDFHRGKGVLSWLLPVLPGPIIWNTAVALAHPALAPLIELQMAGFLVIAAIVVPLNLRMARKIQRRIDALDASRTQ